MTPVVMPETGFPIARITHWFLHEGEDAREGQRVAEVLAGAVLLDIPSPITGRLVRRVVFSGDGLHPGDILGWLE